MTAVEAYLRWVAGLQRFYRIILTVGWLVGIASAAAAAATDSPTMLLVGLGWIVGGSAVVRLADRRESA